HAVTKAVGEVGRDLEGEPGLASAASPGQRHQSDVVTEQELLRGRQLLLAADEATTRNRQVVKTGVVSLERWGPQSDARLFYVERLGAPTEDLLVEERCLGFRLDPKVPLKHRNALLVLAEGGSAPAEVRIEPHQDPMHGLLERVEPDQLERGADRLLEGTGFPLMRQESRQRFKRQLSEPLPLPDEPFLERSLVKSETAQEVSRVELSG